MGLERVTVFGGSGFVGRHLVWRLARRGLVVRVAVRDPVAAEFLRPMGNVGQVVPLRADVSDRDSVGAAVRNTDAVVNLVGILTEGGRASFDAIHRQGAANVARMAKAAGVGRLVHMSALGADPQSPASYARSKAAGEEAVREAFPEAVIARPSIVFGPDDGFFNKFAAIARFSPVLPVIGARPGFGHAEGPAIDLCGSGGPRFQPVYVGDVADALTAMVERPDAAGRTFCLGGPRVYDFKSLLALLLREIDRCRVLIPLPYPVAMVQAALMELLPGKPLTRDQVRLLKVDNVVPAGAEGLESLGVQATPVETILPTYMDRFRVGGRWGRRPTA